MVRTKTLEEHDPVFAKAKAAGLTLLKQTEVMERSGVDTGTVVAVGSTAFRDFGGEAWCAVGDLIAYARHAGKHVTDPFTKEEFLILNDEDVVCVFKE